MNTKIKLASIAIVVMFVTAGAISGVNAQSWYSESLNLDRSSVAGARTTRGKPETNPSTQGTANRPDTSSRGNAASNSTVEPTTTGSENASETVPTFLRKNSFSELKDMKDLTPEERQERITELKNAAKAQRCEVIEENVSRRIDYYQNSQTDHVSRYQGIVLGLTKSSERLTALGYDTTELVLKIEMLQTQINEMNLIHNELIAALQSVNVAQCGEEEEDPSAKGQLARTTVQELRAKALAIKDYIRNEIIPTIQALREQETTPGEEVDETDELPSEETDLNN
jgi:hypothetical protein